MTRRAATPDEPGSNDEQDEDASAFLGDWLAHASSRGADPRPVERPAPRSTPEPELPDPPTETAETAPPADVVEDPLPVGAGESRREQVGGQGAFDFGAFYSSLETGSEAPPEEGTDVRPADETAARLPTAGSHAAPRRGLFSRRTRARRTTEPAPGTDDSRRSDPPPTRPGPPGSGAAGSGADLPNLPPVPPPDYDSFYERLLTTESDDPEPEPVAADPEPEPEPVAADPEPEPEPVAVQPEPERWASDAFVDPAPSPMPPAEAEPEPEPEPEPASAAKPVPHLRSGLITPAPSAAPPPAPAVPQVVEFPRPRAPRIVLTLLLLVTGAAAGVAIWQAAQTEAGYDVGIAGALTALALVFWWGLTTSPMQQVAVRGGILEIEDRESRYTFDLRNPATRIDVEGDPGSRGWKVTIHRHRLAPYVITRRTVDPERFSEVLEHYRGIARKAQEQRPQQPGR